MPDKNPFYKLQYVLISFLPMHQFFISLLYLILNSDIMVIPVIFHESIYFILSQ